MLCPDLQPKCSLAGFSPLPGLFAGLCAWLCVAASVLAAEQPTATISAAADPTTLYSAQVRPLLQKYCLECHSTKKKEGELDLQRFVSPDDLRSDLNVWRKVVEMLEDGQMPPEDETQPTGAERTQLAGWARSLVDFEIRARAGDPGRVIVRRLSNAEYNYTIRDLTGVDLMPGREFPADGAAGEGFANAGDALAMSPTLLGKYLAAAKEVAAHVVLLPDGLRFSPAVTRRDWTNEVLADLHTFYNQSSRGPQDGMLEFRPFLMATLRHRDALLAGTITLAEVAKKENLNPRYLAFLWETLTGTEPSLPLDRIRARWRAATPEQSESIAMEIRGWQGALWDFKVIGSYMAPAWQVAAAPNLVESYTAKVRAPGPDKVSLYLVTRALKGPSGGVATWHRPRTEGGNQPALTLKAMAQSAPPAGAGQPAVLSRADFARFGVHPQGKPVDEDSLVVEVPSVIEVHLPAEARPDREFVVEGRLDPDSAGQIVQFEVWPHSPNAGQPTPHSLPCVASADLRQMDAKQWEPQLDAFRRCFPSHLFYGKIVPDDEIICLRMYFREDEPLGRLFLTDAERQRLDRLWQQLRYVSQEPLVEFKNYETFMGFVSQDGKESYDRVERTTREPVRRRAEVFTQELQASWPSHLDALADFAARAYRRPLDQQDRDKLTRLYEKLRAKEMPHDEAVRAVLAGVLVSPAFLYRNEQPAAGSEARPVSNTELASRLSYFLWASTPDDDLRQAAASGKLSDPTVLDEQVRRMLKDLKTRGLAVEFGTQWLQVRDLRENREKNEKLFPEFNDQLRQSLYEEAVLFFQDLFQNDRSLLVILDSDHTFVDESLARYYGIPGVSGAEWRRVGGVKQQGRGGVIGLGSVLAKQSAASRTSPVLRGNWLVDTLLGEKTPKPPANVPRLPEEESETGDLTVRQLVEKHAHVAECAVCHQRIDPFGFALEKYDAIGRLRDKDSAGRTIATDAQLKDGTRFDGIEGLRQYLLTQRRDHVVRQFCRKLLGYALGRSVVLSDEPLIDSMLAELKQTDYRFSTAVLAIVHSQQFLNHRGLEATKEQ